MNKKLTPEQVAELPDGALVTTAEAADYLGITVLYLNGLRKRNIFDVPMVRCGERAIRFPVKALREFKKRVDETGFFASKPTETVVDISDPNVSDDEVVGISALLKYFRVNNRTITTMIKQGILPPPKRLHKNALRRWRVGDIRKAVGV